MGVVSALLGLAVWWRYWCLNYTQHADNKAITWPNDFLCVASGPADSWWRNVTSPQQLSDFIHYSSMFVPGYVKRGSNIRGGWVHIALYSFFFVFCWVCLRRVNGWEEASHWLRGHYTTRCTLIYPFRNAKEFILSLEFIILLLKALQLREVLAFSTNSFHLVRFLMQSFRFVIFILVISLFTSSSHLFLGLPSDLVNAGAHSYTFFYHAIIWHTMHMSEPS